MKPQLDFFRLVCMHAAIKKGTPLYPCNFKYIIRFPLFFGKP